MIRSDETAVIATDGMQSLIEKIDFVSGNPPKGSPPKSGGMSEKGSNVHETSLKDPSHVRAKGCGRRLKGGKEKATNAAKYRGRRCNGCGKIDQLHNKQNYPVLNNR